MFKRIILKLSGETLAPVTAPEDKKKSRTYEETRIDAAADTIIALTDMGIQVGIVIGGGNIWRGRFTDKMDPVAADQMGMLATVLNALCMQEALIRKGHKAVVYTAQEMTRFAELYRADRARKSLDEGAIVLLAGGSGNPFFTTDTAAALRAVELNADAVFKGTTVDGVFDSDPRDNPNAKLIADITYQKAIDMKLKVMDATAFQMCMDNGLKEIRVFNMDHLENILRVARGETLGTVVHA